MWRLFASVGVVMIGAMLLWMYSQASDAIDSECIVAGKQRSPILWNPDVSTSASPGMLEPDATYKFVEFGDTWSLDGNSGRWIKIIVELNPSQDNTVSYGWVLDRNVTLHGDCPSSS